MRALMFEAAGVLGWHEVPDPDLPPGGALVRPLAVARCDLDLPMTMFGIFPGPFVVGHECLAEVVAVHDSVSTVTPGQRVLVPYQVSCGTCRSCGGSRFAACRTYRARVGATYGFGLSGGDHGGAVADLMAVPHADHLLLAVPDGSPDAALCVLPDNVSDGYRAVAEPLRREPGADVLVVGGSAPSIGLYATAAALALGAGEVRYVDTDAERCAMAERLGARVTHHRGDWPRRFDPARVTVDNTGSEAGLASVLRSTDGYGYCTSVTIHFQPTTAIPLLEMYTRGITFHVSRADSRRLLPEVLRLVGDGRLDPLAVPVTSADWADADRAWSQPATKLVLQRAEAAGGRRAAAGRSGTSVGGAHPPQRI